MPNYRNGRQPVPDLERKLVEVDVRIEEVALVLASGLERKLVPLRLDEEVLLSL